MNDAAFFLSHRLPVAELARSRGYDVHVAAPRAAACDEIEAHGFPLHSISLGRRSLNPFAEIRTLVAVSEVVRRTRPDILHAVTVKPVLYGGAIARLMGVPAVVSSVSGLGYVFLAEGIRGRLLRSAVLSAYRFSLAHQNSRTVFANPDDEGTFVGSGCVRPDRAVRILGSGVDVGLFRPGPDPTGTPLVVLPARLLWHKGVGEFVEAARILRSRGVSARLALVGDTDTGNPAGVPRATIDRWAAAGDVEWWGRQSDMPRVLASAHVACLPSYREGLPKALAEAAACGLPIVCTDVPGCRETVEHGRSGFLVPPRDPKALADALARLVGDSDLRRRMGEQGRQLAVARFALQRIAGQTVDLFDKLLGRPTIAPGAETRVEYGFESD